MVRFLHTADWQMGMKAVHTGERAKDVRQRREETARRIIDEAKKADIDFILLAGDTFEHPTVDDVVVKRTVDILNQFDPIPVYILPGNHDPWVSGGIWDRDSWQRIGSHVTLMTEAVEYSHSDAVVLYPCPLTQKRSGRDPTAWIPKRAEGDNRIRVGLAHGSLDVISRDTNFPIPKDRPEQSGLDYLALGDWHSYHPQGKAVYSGTMEPTGFGERDSGNILIVDIKTANSMPQIEVRRINTLTWVEISPEIRDSADVEAFNSEVDRLGTLSSKLLKISPSLEDCSEEIALQRLETVRSDLLERAFFLDWVDPIIQPILDDLTLPEGTLAQMDDALASILDGKIPDGPGQQFAGSDRTIVQQARQILRRIAGGRSA